jgi:hypothetical protein
MKKIFSFENYDPYQSFHELDTGEGLLCDSEGNEIPGTEELWLVGKAAYDHIIEVNSEDDECILPPEEYLHDRTKFVFESVDTFLQQAIKNKVVFSFPSPVGEISGEALESELWKREPTERLEILLEYFKLLEEHDMKVVLFHKSGIHALGCLCEMDFIASIAQYCDGSTARWVRLCCNWREKMRIEIALKDELKSRSVTAARKRHSETDSMKNDVLKVYNENQRSYKSVADAARKLTKEVPVTTRTIEKWIRQSKK